MTALLLLDNCLTMLLEKNPRHGPKNFRGSYYSCGRFGTLVTLFDKSFRFMTALLLLGNLLTQNCRYVHRLGTDISYQLRVTISVYFLESVQIFKYAANVYMQTTDELIFKSVISTQRYLYF